ncbi:unnamed protein product [Clavelina lepadiformis]|uniref:Uncharacterized protein n=1 Tax=Clavelina lepadiformis TaxID=159417 RepID=A0ABP0FR80_CLALP
MLTDHLTADFPDVESDGRLLRQVRDPPGQRSHYIGYHPVTQHARPTAFQLSNYFPEKFSLSLRHRTKCFSCGQSIQEWEVEEDPKLLRWHRSNCDITNGSDTRNKPIDSIIRQFELTPPHDPRNATSLATRPPAFGNPQASEDQRRPITAGKVITNGIGITSNSPNATAVTMFQTATFKNTSYSTPPPSVVASGELI